MTERRDRKDMLLEAGLTLAAELSLPIVLQRIVDLAAQITEARYGALGVIGEGNELVEFETTGISSKRRRDIGALPRGRGVVGLDHAGDQQGKKGNQAAGDNSDMRGDGRTMRGSQKRKEREARVV